MFDFMSTTYGGYTKEDLEKLYNEDKIKNSLLYTNEIKSRLVKSIEVLIENGYGLRVARINTDDIIEVVFYDNQLFYAVGKVGTISTPESILLDCSSIYNTTIKSIPVGNIRYIKLVSKEDAVKGGLLIPLSTLNNILHPSDNNCGCGDGNWHNIPVDSNDDDVTAAEKALKARQDKLDKEMIAYARYFQAAQESIWKDKMRNKDINESTCKSEGKTYPYSELFKIWEGSKWAVPNGYEPIKQETTGGSTVDMYPYTVPWHCNDNSCGSPMDGGNFCCHHSSIPCNHETTLPPNELNEKFAWHNEFNKPCKKDEKEHSPIPNTNPNTPFDEELDDSRSLRDIKMNSDGPFKFHEYNGERDYKDEFKPAPPTSKTDNDLDDLRSIKDETPKTKDMSTQTEETSTEDTGVGTETSTQAEETGTSTEDTGVGTSTIEEEPKTKDAETQTNEDTPFEFHGGTYPHDERYPNVDPNESSSSASTETSTETEETSTTEDETPSGNFFDMLKKNAGSDKSSGRSERE